MGKHPVNRCTWLDSIALVCLLGLFPDRLAEYRKVIESGDVPRLVLLLLKSGYMCMILKGTSIHAINHLRVDMVLNRRHPGEGSPYVGLLNY